MASRGYYDHISPDGISNIDRFNKAGLSCFHYYPDGTYSNGSENLSKGMFVNAGTGAEGYIAR
ncbi:MAG: hypothetical protein ABI361_03310 [Nitrososphaera sp.]|jgi:uncharacterized protein YkwD